MSLLLHTEDGGKELANYYIRAFADAVELFIVTAYFTDWDASLILNPDCQNFRVIIGKDFGITRKAVCEKLMRWLPSKRKGQFMVADGISGFHPKCVFWKEKTGLSYAVVGYSNLTRAAFTSNYEANVYCTLSVDEYAEAKRWVKRIESQSVPVSEDWLKKYKEARPAGRRGSSRHKLGVQAVTPLLEIKLPKPRGMIAKITQRRHQLAAYKNTCDGLMLLFRRCASGDISSGQFYHELPQYWSHSVGDRLQGKGFEIKGKNGDFQALSKSFVRILDATIDNRDDVVVEEIDRLSELRVPTRQAFLTEMLCLRFPEYYPVLNKPVQDYIRAIKFKGPRGSSKGVQYIDLAIKLRHSLRQDPDYPAKNLAELDTVIWLKYGLSLIHI